MDWRQRYLQRDDLATITLTRMGRTFRVAPRYYRLVSWALDRPDGFTLREAAAALGYSLKGVWAALRSLAAMGIARVTTSRGRFGRTRLTLSSDARAANVSTAVRREISTETDQRAAVETFSQEARRASAQAYAQLVSDRIRQRLLGPSAA